MIKYVRQAIGTGGRYVMDRCGSTGVAVTWTDSLDLALKFDSVNAAIQNGYDVVKCTAVSGVLYRNDDPAFPLHTDASQNYENCRLVNIQRGKGKRDCYVYADIVSSSGEVLVSATLDYCAQVLKDRVP